MHTIRLFIGAALALTGLYLAVFGKLPDSQIGFWPELIVPFLPLAFIGFGATLFVSSRR